MQPIDLLMFLRHVEQHAPCPHCGAAVHPEDIEILSHTDNSILFHAVCPDCSQSLHAQALFRNNAVSEQLESDLLDETFFTADLEQHLANRVLSATSLQDLMNPNA